MTALQNEDVYLMYNSVVCSQEFLNPLEINKILPTCVEKNPITSYYDVLYTESAFPHKLLHNDVSRDIFPWQTLFLHQR